MLFLKERYRICNFTNFNSNSHVQIITSYLTHLVFLFFILPVTVTLYNSFVLAELQAASCTLLFKCTLQFTHLLTVIVGRFLKFPDSDFT